MTTRLKILSLAAIATIMLSGCDVEQQMDTMIDNPSFADPIFAKLMARSDYQDRAIHTLLQDPALRQRLLERLVMNASYAKDVAEQLMGNPTTRDMLSQLMAARQGEIGTP